MVPNHRGYPASLTPEHVEAIMGLPTGHTAGVSNQNSRCRFVGQAFNVDFVKMMLGPVRVEDDSGGLVVICPFAGVGADLVALEMLGVRVKAVLTMEKLSDKREILKEFLADKAKDASSSFHRARHWDWGDLCQEGGIWRERHGWELIVRELGIRAGNVLYSGGPPCDNLPGTSNQGAGPTPARIESLSRQRRRPRSPRRLLHAYVTVLSRRLIPFPLIPFPL